MNTDVTPPHRVFRLNPALLGVLTLLPLVVQADPVPAPLPAQRQAPRISPSPRAVAPALEPDAAVFAAGPNPFSSKAVPLVPGQTLTAPVTVNAFTSADAMTVTQTGAGRAITGSVSSTSNSLSAIKGITAGSGSGVNGANSGTAGPAGKFQITASGSKQPALVSTTAGTGNAVQGVITSGAESNTPAILGQHLGGPDSTGVGVEGDGNLAGVMGVSDYNYGVFGMSPGGSGVFGEADAGSGVEGRSSTGAALYGYSTSGRAVYGSSGNGIGVYGTTSNSSSYAGYFDGQVKINGVVEARNYLVTSDRAVKQAFHEVDSADLLQRIDAMHIGGWDFQAAPGIHHIGPMAQDFRAAFGLGVDDKHIDMTDGLGVSLAAIQALKRQLDAKDASNADLRARVAALESQIALAQPGVAAIDNLAARLAALEQGAQRAAPLPNVAQP